MIMALRGNPLVSCVCPTKDRRAYIPQMIRSWLSQTYENRELIILDDGADPVGDLLPERDPRIFYYHFAGKLNVPQKRNWLAKAAAGELICHFDDDDWSHPERVAFQVQLHRQFTAGIVGFHRLLFWDTRDQRGWQYKGDPGYCLGTSMCYRKTFWACHPFPEHVPVASDNAVVYPAMKRGQTVTTDGGQLLVARIHNTHTSEKAINNEQWNPIPWEGFPEGFREAKVNGHHPGQRTPVPR